MQMQSNMQSMGQNDLHILASHYVAAFIYALLAGSLGTEKGQLNTTQDCSTMPNIPNKSERTGALTSPTRDILGFIASAAAVAASQTLARLRIVKDRAPEEGTSAPFQP